MCVCVVVNFRNIHTWAADFCMGGGSSLKILMVEAQIFSSMGGAWGGTSMWGL